MSVCNCETVLNGSAIAYLIAFRNWILCYWVIYSLSIWLNRKVLEFMCPVSITVKLCFLRNHGVISCFSCKRYLYAVRSDSVLITTIYPWLSNWNLAVYSRSMSIGYLESVRDISCDFRLISIRNRGLYHCISNFFSVFVLIRTGELAFPVITLIESNWIYRIRCTACQNLDQIYGNASRPDSILIAAVNPLLLYRNTAELLRSVRVGYCETIIDISAAAYRVTSRNWLLWYWVGYSLSIWLNRKILKHMSPSSILAKLYIRAWDCLVSDLSYKCNRNCIRSYSVLIIIICPWLGNWNYTVYGRCMGVCHCEAVIDISAVAYSVTGRN